MNNHSVTLQSLSLEAKKTMKHSPLYNMFRHAFLLVGSVAEGETEGSFDGQAIDQYGDTLVNDLFALNLENIETEAAVVMNVWMAAAFEIFEANKACRGADRIQGLEHLDRAVAYWVGAGQQTGDNDGGHLLYNLAENAGERFGQDEGETLVNRGLMELFLTMQTDFLANKCNTDAGYLEMRSNVKKIISLMTIPLVQNFIHHTMNLDNEGGSSFVELYALATIPRVAACDPTAFFNDLRLEVLRKMTPQDIQNAIVSIQDNFKCLGITCAQVGSYLDGSVPQCQDPVQTSWAGYSTTSSIAGSLSMLDRDIKEIDVFLKFNDKDSARDWYENGWNSDVYSLQDLATDQVVPPTLSTSYFDLFESYFPQVQYADSLIRVLFDGAAPYDVATKEDIRYLATGNLQNSVIFTTATTALQYASEQCSSNVASALDYWDAGVVLYIGSMEGDLPNGSEKGGEFLYTTARDLCEDFATCDPQVQGVKGALVNTALMQAFEQGQNAIQSGNCAGVLSFLDTQILPSMVIPLFQGLIKYASASARLPAGSDDPSLAIADSYLQGLLPIIYQSSPGTAAALQNELRFPQVDKPVPGGYASVVNALRTALQDLPTNCNDVGFFAVEGNLGDMCAEPTGGVPVPTITPVAAPTNAPIAPVNPGPASDIAFGRYKFEDIAVAEADSSFALDVRDMYQASSVEEAREVYTSGRNALPNGLSGTSGITSLASFSREAARFMIDDPMFNVFRYALYNDEDLEDGSGEDFLYADDVVVEALDGAKDIELAAEAAVVMNSWMVIVHQLYEASRICMDGGDPVSLIDSAVALWIGKSQGEGQYGNGWMMYSVGQSVAQFYGLPEAESPVNKQLMDLFNQAQAFSKTCSSVDDADLDLYYTVNELVRTLSKPLILALLFHLASSSKNEVELYSVAVIPQASVCNDVLGQELQDAFFEDYSDARLSDATLDRLVTFLRCQRITSSDLTHGEDIDIQLKVFLESLTQRLDYYLDASEFLPMAGYTPNTDVYEVSRLDLDVSEVMLLSRAGAYGAARDVYEYGHHAMSINESSRYLSLQSLATSEERDGILAFQLFREYYSSADYADDIMESALTRTSPYSSATRGETGELAMTALQVMVSFMGILSKMQSSILNCNAGKVAAAQADWDSAVALYVGSMEGELAGGIISGDGVFLFALGNELCDDFGRCEVAEDATINEEILYQFAVGRDSVAESNCDHIDRLLTWEILPRLKIPLVQGTISFALQNFDIAARDPDTLATAHILAKSILPFVNQANSTSAATIASEWDDFTQVSSGRSVDAVVDAFAYALRGMGISCEDVGTPVDYPSLSLCRGVDDTDGNVPDQVPVSQTTTDLADGLYVTTTYVQDRANIAKDIAAMKEAMVSNSYDLARLIYRNGENSEVYDANGKFLSLRSLQKFSTEETSEMLDEPLFSFFLYALRDGQGCPCIR